MPVPINQRVKVAGDLASGTGESGNPIKIGGRARTTNPTAVSDGQRVEAGFDKLGRQVMVAGQVRDLIGQQSTTISNTTETTIVTAIASTFCDLCLLVITNETATAVKCTLKDSTAGTTRGVFALAANGGIVIPFPRPLPQATVNNNWTLTLSASSITVDVFVEYEKNT